MNKKLPSIFKNTNFNIVNNNKKTFYSLEKVSDIVEQVDNESSILDEYVFNIPLEIITYDKTINASIVSKVGDHILTNNNQIIKLEDIRTIKRKSQ